MGFKELEKGFIEHSSSKRRRFYATVNFEVVILGHIFINMAKFYFLLTTINYNHDLS